MVKFMKKGKEKGLKKEVSVLVNVYRYDTYHIYICIYSIVVLLYL